LAADGAVYRQVCEVSLIKSNQIPIPSWKPIGRLLYLQAEVWSGECSAAVFSQFWIDTCHCFGDIAN